MAFSTAEEVQRAGRAAWDVLQFQYPEAEYASDGWWYRGSLRAGGDRPMSGSLLGLVKKLRSGEEGQPR